MPVDTTHILMLTKKITTHLFEEENGLKTSDCTI